jgi:hypothetical protein
MLIKTMADQLDHFYSRWPRAQSWLWLVTLWLAGFLFLVAVAYGIRALLPRTDVFHY